MVYLLLIFICWCDPYAQYNFHHFLSREFLSLKFFEAGTLFCHQNKCYTLLNDSTGTIILEKTFYKHYCDFSLKLFLKFSDDEVILYLRHIQLCTYFPGGSLRRVTSIWIFNISSYTLLMIFKRFGKYFLNII